MKNKIGTIIYKICEWLELLMAVAVLIGLVIAASALLPEFKELFEHRTEAGAFWNYLDAVFSVVVGIEFMKMLCIPSPKNIIETLIFLIARHMIIKTTTSVDDLLSVISIGILFFFWRYTRDSKPDENFQFPKLFKRKKNPAGSPRDEKSNDEHIVQDGDQ